MVNKVLLCIFIIAGLLGCKETNNTENNLPDLQSNTPKYATGFTIKKGDYYSVITVTNPWPEAERHFTYLLLGHNMPVPENVNYNTIVRIPVKKVVVTSTTHIPALESLGVLNSLIGFPDTHYISSKKARNLVEDGHITELGSNESINAEVLLNLKPDVVFGFSINNANKTYNTIKNSGIPVVYNGDWTEQTPLGKAEWIKFFAPFFNKEKVADSLFSVIEQNYINAKKIAAKTKVKPKVISGSMYKDVWYAPAGNSWMATFLEDANANYVWKNTKGTGSLTLSFESALEQGTDAAYWIAPGQFVSYTELLNESEHYQKFKSFINKKIYTFSLTKGETGGILYYELAPNRPDIVLKDIIKIVHPNVLPDYKPVFFKPLLP